MNSSSKYSTLEQLLDDYRQNGVDSEGHFTINPVRARELLKQFQLPEPAHYILHILSFLVGAGATSIVVNSSRNALLIEAPGALVVEETIRNPFAVLLSSDNRGHLSELALGLNTLLGQSGAKAELSFDRWMAKYEPRSINVRNIPVTKDLSLTTSPRLGARGQERELELIREWFAYAPIPIKLNGELISGQSTAQSGQGLEIYLENSRFPLSLNEGWQNRVTKTNVAPFSALVRIGRSRSVLRLLSFGRAYEQVLPWSFFVPGWQVCITVNSDQLRKDLSQQEILHTEKFQNLCKFLRDQVEQASELLLTRLPPLPGSEELVDDLVDQLYLQGQKELAHAFQTRLVQSFAVGPHTLERARALYRLALMEKNLDRAGGMGVTIKDGLDALQASKNSRALEPEWSVLKARMVFDANAANLRWEVRDFAIRPKVGDEKRELCYRWLLTHPQEDPRDKAVYQVEIAQFAYRSGRLAEALEILEQLSSGEGNRLLQESLEFSLLAAQMHGEIASGFGYLEKAIEMFGRELALLRQRHGQYSLKLGLTLERLAYLLDYAGQPKQAQEYRAWSRRLHD